MDLSLEIATTSAKETHNLARRVADIIKPSDVICLCGDLGSGKTTFIQGLAKGLGIEQLPQSPTFILIREYPVYRKDITVFYHVDLYRILENQIRDIGLDPLLKQTNAITAIEWADHAWNLLPDKKISVFFRYGEDNTRIINIKDSSNEHRENLLRKSISYEIK